MKINRVYKGKIMKCNYFKKDNSGSYAFFVDSKNGKNKILEDEFVKEAILIKIHNDKYIDVDLVKNNFELFKSIIEDSTITITPRHWGDRYVLEKSLKPYFVEAKQKTSIKQLKLNQTK